ncbi:MAG: 1-deoxy-D-xylulose-5-phosphate reductoisomerase [Candidatus Aminicenantales bacterium]
MKRQRLPLGSTGSIGRNALEVIAKSRGRFEVAGLAAGRNLRLFLEQVKTFRPRIVSLEREEDARDLAQSLNEFPVTVTHGQEGAEEVARFPESDIIVSAITGIDGLRPTMAAVMAGKRVALANKESMVVAGPLILEEARRSGSEIIPVDSEHSGVFQCLSKERKADVKKVILTASGGPFFRLPADEMKDKSLEEALDHPSWKMGKKVTIDSATLMNKGLELIEARWLFGLKPDQLDILIHPQSIVHSLVEMRDGSVLAQMSPTDMRIPIQYALTYPGREEALMPSLDLGRVGALEFFRVDTAKFPLVGLAHQALREGGSLPVALNAANEVAVAAFIQGRIPFSGIAEVVQKAVLSHRQRRVENLEDVFAVDRETRSGAWDLVRKR